jgi:hypothetical protein
MDAAVGAGRRDDDEPALGVGQTADEVEISGHDREATGGGRLPPGSVPSAELG